MDQLWTITQEMVATLALELVETLTHEYRHLHQHRQRAYLISRAYRSRAEDIKLREEQEYLGSTDEIDAYAANIAVKFFLVEKKLITQTEYTSFDLGSYYKVFGPHHPVIKRLLKKIYKNLGQLRNLAPL